MVTNKKKYIFLVALIFVMAAFFVGGRVLAYSITYPYKLVGGITDRNFNISDPNGNWKTSVRNGVSAWNATPTRANYIESSTSNRTLDFYVGNYGNSGWCGVTLYVDADGFTMNYGGYPSKNWYSNDINLNEYYTNVCGTTKKSIVVHEMGHSMGLRHSTDPNSVMIEGSKLETPKTDDINGLNAMLYN